jgi:hypothetical protein
MLALSGGSILAVKPVDGEVGAFWWANDYESPSGSTDADAAGLRGELWVFDRFGVQAMQSGSDVGGSEEDSAGYTSVDAMWRALAFSKNNFLAVGLGWQRLDLAPVGMDDSTSGARLALQGRVSLLDYVYAYGHGAYSPALQDVPASSAASGSFEDLDGLEYELGVAWNVGPFVSLRAGYRANRIDFRQTSVESLPQPTAGGSPLTIEGGNGGIDNVSAAIGAPPCTGCATTSTSDGGSSESDGYFLGLGIRF